MFRQCIVIALLLFLVGCGQGPHPRLGVLLGTHIQQQQPSSRWPPMDQVGLIVHSDMTGPGAAPAISDQFLGTLRYRTEELIAQRCLVPAIVHLTFPSATQQTQIKRELISRGHKHDISYILLVLLSSREQTGPVTLGEERMMTQMSGTSVENMALSEVALLRLSDYVMTFVIGSGATETLELLDAPLGKGQPTREQSLKILRAQAGQQALDRSLNVLGQWCEGIPEKDWK